MEAHDIEVEKELELKQLKLVCAWCGCIMRDGDEPTSHGICPDCLVQERKR